MPKDAIRLVEGYNQKIDMLITDIIMPVMNGLELAEIICSIRPGIKCIFISGYPTDTISDSEVFKKNINYIRKPFRLKDFAEKIRIVLDS
jgi:YesN/AraC family two-component response regulator